MRKIFLFERKNQISDYIELIKKKINSVKLN